MMLDRIDHKILEILQADGRITNVDLAEKINLSPTACLKRVKKIESSGVIKGYKAVLDPEKLGYNINLKLAIQHAKLCWHLVNP